MKVIFDYDKEKDTWCLLNKGKSSNNSQTPTETYEQLVAMFGENPTQDNVIVFVENYIRDDDIDLKEIVARYKKEWATISSDFQKRAEAIFNVSLPQDITAYLTVNTRCPYSINENYFLVHLNAAWIRKTAMHELWHFYTWYGIGPEQEAKLGKQKYNDIKEALTVLLNIECKDLMPDGVSDTGYPQHKELREEIIESWSKEKNIRNLWQKVA